MSTIKKLIQERIVNPVNHNRGVGSAIAEIMAADEKNNLCSIRYFNKDGIVMTKDNIPVQIYSQGFVDWFPQKGDFVKIEEAGDHVLITAKFIGNYHTDIRARNKLTKDVCADSSDSTLGGFIF